MAEYIEPRIVKVSSKRQITIPVNIYKRLGFGEFALLEITEDGLFISPVEAKSEDTSVDLLRFLINQGYEGEDLIEKYANMKGKLFDVNAVLSRAENNMARGKVHPYEKLRREVRAKHGI